MCLPALTKFSIRLYVHSPNKAPNSVSPEVICKSSLLKEVKHKSLKANSMCFLLSKSLLQYFKKMWELPSSPSQYNSPQRSNFTFYLAVSENLLIGTIIQAFWQKVTVFQKQSHIKTCRDIWKKTLKIFLPFYTITIFNAKVAFLLKTVFSDL